MMPRLAVPNCLRDSSKLHQLLALLLLGLLTITSPTTLATPLPAGAEYEVHYDILLGAGTANGNDIRDTFIFEWDDSGALHVDYAYTIAGIGRTRLSHFTDFVPRAALLIGYNLGIPGVGDGKDHLFTLTNRAFARSAEGVKWSQMFPGIPPIPRKRHSEMVTLLMSAAAGDTAALAELVGFVDREGAQAAFAPNGPTHMIEWTGGSIIDIDEPGSVLLGLLGAMLLFGCCRRLRPD